MRPSIWALTKESGEWKVSLDTCLDYTSVTGSEDLQSALAGFGEDDTDGAITVPQMDETQMDAVRKQADAGDTCYTDRLTAGANFLHLIGGEAFEFGGEVYYIWPAGGMVRLDMAQVDGIWMVERVAINPLPFSPQDAQTLVAEGAPWEAEITYEGLCPDADDIWYLFSVNDGEQRYEVCAANGMLRRYREERWVYPVTKERKIKHQHADQPVAGTYAWEGLYYVSQYEAAPIPVMLVRDESDPTRLWYQYGEEGTLYPAQISGNMAYDEQNDITHFVLSACARHLDAEKFRGKGCTVCLSSLDRILHQDRRYVEPADAGCQEAAGSQAANPAPK